MFKRKFALVLFLILFVACFSKFALKVNAVSPTQQVVNGGFETGNFNGWASSNNWSIATSGTLSVLASPHSGTYFAYGVFTNNLLSQSFNGSIAVSSVTDCEAYIGGNGYPATINMTVIYSDNTTTIASNTVNSGVWYLVNMTSSLSVGKNISSIQFKWFSAGYISAVGVDDVSLIGTPTVTSTFNVSPSVINNAQVSYNGTTQTIPFNISTSSGNIYVLNATQSLSYSGLQYIFSSWLINGTNSYTNMTLTFQINGNTTFQVNYLFICTLTLTSNYDPAPFTIDSIANVTPFMMNLVSGTHVIIFNATFYYAGPFGAEAVYFDYWNDTNSTSPTRTIDLESDSNYTVLYSLTPPNSTSPPTLNLPSGMPLLWQYIANFDLLGFIVACYVSLIGEAFYAFVIFISFSLVYLKTKSVVLCSILWLLLGGVFMQMTKIISPIAVILVALGITGMIYRLFTHNE